jgi:hypothetical protein
MQLGRLLVSLWLMVGVSACQSVSTLGESSLIWLSLVTLLGNPPEYDNIHVETMGFLADERVPDLFLTRDHAEAYDVTSGIPLESDEAISSDCFNKYVYVIGRFVLDHETVGRYLQVQSITDASTKETCWRAE